MAKKKAIPKEKKWIQKAIKSPGALTRQAKAKGMTVGKFASEVGASPKRYRPTTRKRVVLAKTLKKLSKGRKRRRNG